MLELCGFLVVFLDLHERIQHHHEVAAQMLGWKMRIEIYSIISISEINYSTVLEYLFSLDVFYSCFVA